MSTFTLELPTSQERDPATWAAVAFIASYSSEETRRTYTTQLRLWMGWCANHHLDPLADIRRPLWSCTPASSKPVGWPRRRSR